MLRTLFVDFNSYFASVEQQEQPHLRGQPVAVVPLLAETTSCIAASYEAKAFGVRTGTRVAEARRLCPGIHVVQARQPLYVQYHQRAVEAVDSVAPVRQVLSIDEMECELTGRWRERERALALARQVKARIIASVGECLRSSIGIAPNTLLGKIASDMRKPDGLVVIEQHELPQALYGLELTDINGIGPRMKERLERSGIHTVQQLCAAPRDLLRTAWGGVAGLEMHDKLRGQWYGPRQTVASSISHSHVMPPDMRHPQGAADVLNRLTQKAAMRLRKQGFYATAMSVSVRSEHRYQREPAHGAGRREARFGQTQDTAALLHVLDTLWRDGLHLLPHPLHVGVTLHGLVPVAQHTPSLFDVPGDVSRAEAPSPACSPSPARDRSRLYQALDAVNRTHGKNAVYFASAHAARDHAPMRIAFNRIPDIETEA